MKQIHTYFLQEPNQQLIPCIKFLLLKIPTEFLFSALSPD